MSYAHWPMPSSKRDECKREQSAVGESLDLSMLRMIYLILKYQAYWLVMPVIIDSLAVSMLSLLSWSDCCSCLNARIVVCIWVKIWPVFYLFSMYCSVTILGAVCDEPLSSNKGRESLDQLRSFKISKEWACTVAYRGTVYLIFQEPLLRLGPYFSHPWQSQRVHRHYSLLACKG